MFTPNIGDSRSNVWHLHLILITGQSSIRFLSLFSELSLLCLFKSSAVPGWCDMPAYWPNFTSLVSKNPACAGPGAACLYPSPLDAFWALEWYVLNWRRETRKRSSPASPAHIIPSVEMARMRSLAVRGMCRHLNIEAPLSQPSTFRNQKYVTIVQT